MSTIIVKRSRRQPGSAMPEGEVELAEPPVLPEAATADFGSTLGFLPMALGGGMMALLFSVGGGSKSTYLISGVMGVSMMSMGASQIGRG
jgi:S-DNA-T family DNA segregation ATPase FtsK/SpoIIIE